MFDMTDTVAGRDEYEKSATSLTDGKNGWLIASHIRLAAER